MTERKGIKEGCGGSRLFGLSNAESVRLSGIFLTNGFIRKPRGECERGAVSADCIWEWLQL
jgi:hypothetical protein